MQGLGKSCRLARYAMSMRGQFRPIRAVSIARIDLRVSTNGAPIPRTLLAHYRRPLPAPVAHCAGMNVVEAEAHPASPAPAPPTTPGPFLLPRRPQPTPPRRPIEPRAATPVPFRIRDARDSAIFLVSELPLSSLNSGSRDCRTRLRFVYQSIPNSSQTASSNAGFARELKRRRTPKWRNTPSCRWPRRQKSLLP
jgi:hypothetical protein